MDESVFQAFYEKTSRPLWRYIAGMVRDNAVADDLFQESYVRLLQSGVDFADEARMKSYLYRTATNCVRDYWRKTKREREWVGTEEAEAADTRDTVALRHDVEEAFAGLSPQQRALLWLAFAEEYTHREIAEILGLKEQSVKVLLFRAKQKMLRRAGQLEMTRKELP